MEDTTPYGLPRWAPERAFFHDIANLATTVVANSELQLLESPDERSRLRAERVVEAAQRLASEIGIQRLTHHLDSPTPIVKPQTVHLQPFVRDLVSHARSRPEATRTVFEVCLPATDIRFRSDRSLLSRVLENMILNAVEASPPGHPVRVTAKLDDAALAFTVWSSPVIPETVAHRVFRPGFSTKAGTGRGFGTYSMKLLAETCLGGSVDFTSEPGAGTEFRVRLPLEPAG